MCTMTGFTEDWDADVMMDYISRSSIAGIEELK